MTINFSTSSVKLFAILNSSIVETKELGYSKNIFFILQQIRSQLVKKGYFKLLASLVWKQTASRVALAMCALLVNWVIPMISLEDKINQIKI